MPGSNMDDGSDSLSSIEEAAHAARRKLETYVCARCAVYKDSEASTFSKRDAIMHLVSMHPHKLVDALSDEGLIRMTDVELELLLQDNRHKGG